MPTAARTDEEFAARFWSKVEKTSTCWLWRGALTSAGYGSLRRDQRGSYAHRAAYELTVEPIPNGFYVCHRCDTPACVRPDHLFLGTAKDNSQDCAAKIRGNGRPHTAVARLTPEAVRRIRKTYAEQTVSQRQLAEEFGVAQMTISKVVRRVSWPHL